MKCDRCGAENYSRVLDTRASTKYGFRRRRECLKCGFRFTTYEIKPSDLLRQYEAVVHTRVFSGIKSSE